MRARVMINVAFLFSAWLSVCLPAVGFAEPSEQTQTLLEQARQAEAQNELRSAVELYSAVVRLEPAHVGARKAWARALLKLSEQYEKVGLEKEAARAVQQAFQIDASLADDPVFVERFKQFNTPDAGTGSDAFGRPLLSHRTARQGKWLGLHFGSGIEAVAGLGLDLFLFQHAQISATLNMIFPSLAVEARALFLKSNWTPFVSVGGSFDLDRSSTQRFYSDAYNGHFFYLRAGAQYMHPSGFFLDLGFTWAFKRDHCHR